MLGHLAELDWAIGYEFREGREAPQSRNLEFLKQCFKRMPKGHRIRRVRIDSAGYQKDIFEWLDQQGVKFTVTGRKNTNILREIELIEATEWKSLKSKAGVPTDREVAETWASMEDGVGYFRIVVQRWMKSKQELFENGSNYCYHVICTNYSKEEKSASELIYWHNGRAASENYYREAKTGFNLHYLPCDDFKANAIWFALAMMAYNSHIFVKAHFLPDSWRKKTIHTIRWQLICITGKVVKHARDIWLKLSDVTDEIIDIFQQARRLCRAYAGP